MFSLPVLVRAHPVVSLVPVYLSFFYLSASYIYLIITIDFDTQRFPLNIYDVSCLNNINGSEMPLLKSLSVLYSAVTKYNALYR